jgi:hypothetical protein
MRKFLQSRSVRVNIVLVILIIGLGVFYYVYHSDTPTPTDKGHVSLELNGIINTYTQSCSELKSLMESYKSETNIKIQQQYIAQIGLKHNELSQIANEYNSKSETKIKIPTLDDFSKLSLDEILKLSF